MKPENEKLKIASGRVPPEQWLALDQWAEDKGVTFSQAVCTAIANLLKREEKREQRKRARAEAT